jgi:hypothetical protein
LDFTVPRKTTLLDGPRLSGYPAVSSYVYSNMSPVPMPYKWDVQGDTLTISVAYDPINATFKGKFSQDGKRFSGGWRPNPGADETINVPYDIGGTRVK